MGSCGVHKWTGVLLDISKHIHFNNPWHLTYTLSLRCAHTPTHSHTHSPSAQKEQLNGAEHIVALTFCASYPSQSSKPWQLTLLAFCHGALACTVAGSWGGREIRENKTTRKSLFFNIIFEVKWVWAMARGGLVEAFMGLVILGSLCSADH